MQKEKEECKMWKRSKQFANWWWVYAWWRKRWAFHFCFLILFLFSSSSSSSSSDPGLMMMMIAEPTYHFSWALWMSSATLVSRSFAFCASSLLFSFFLSFSFASDFRRSTGPRKFPWCCEEEKERASSLVVVESFTYRLGFFCWVRRLWGERQREAERERRGKSTPCKISEVLLERGRAGGKEEEEEEEAWGGGEGTSAGPWVCERNTQLRHGISLESMHMQNVTHKQSVRVWRNSPLTVAKFSWETERQREKIPPPPPPPRSFGFQFWCSKEAWWFQNHQNPENHKGKTKNEKIRHSENHSYHILLPTRRTCQFHKALKNLKEMQGNWSRVKDPPFSPNRPPTDPPTHQFLLEEYAMRILEYAENLKFVRIECWQFFEFIRVQIFCTLFSLCCSNPPIRFYYQWQ